MLLAKGKRSDAYGLKKEDIVYKQNNFRDIKYVKLEDFQLKR